MILKGIGESSEKFKAFVPNFSLNLFSLKRKFVQIKIVGKSFYLSKYLKVFSQDGKIARRQSMHGETRIVVK